MKKPLWHRLHDFFLPHARNEHQPGFFSTTSIGIIAATVLVLEFVCIAQVALVFPNTNFLASVLPGVLTSLTNEARATNDVPAVSRNALLDTAAQFAADDMAAKGYFAHVSPDGKTPWYWLDKAGYTYTYAGENLAVNFSDTNDLETAWMNSPTHRANIVKPEYTEVGFGTAEGMYEGKQTTFVAEFFATPAAAPSPIEVVTEVKPTTVAVATTTAPVATATGAVLGTEAPTTPVNVVQSAPPTLLTRVSSSPFSTMARILTSLCVLIVLLVVAALVRHFRLPHPRVAIGGALLIALVAILFFLNPLFAGQLKLSLADSAQASAALSFPTP